MNDIILNTELQNTSEINLMTFLNKWVEYQKMFVKESTYATYKNMITMHINPSIGNLKLNQINNDVIQDFVIEKSLNGRLDGNGGLARKTVSNMVMTLKVALRFLFRKKIIEPFELYVKYPYSEEKSKVDTFNKREIKIITKKCLTDNSKHSVGVLISLYTGLRIGEICALKVSDIDFDNNVLEVNKTLQRIYLKEYEEVINSKISITSPKTRSSKRTVPIPNFIIEMLKQFNFDNETFVLTGTEKSTEPRTYRAYFERLLNGLNIKHRSFHTLRHTFATNCVELGIDVKTISDLLGHANVITTLNLYVHTSFTQKENAINKLTEFFNNEEL